MNLTPTFIRRRIEHRPNLVKIVDNIGWLFFDKVLRMGVGVLVGVWVARYLGPEQFGLLNFALAFTGLFGAIASLGLQGIVVRDIVRDPEGARLTLGTAAVLQLVGGLASLLLILGAIAYLRPDDALVRTIVAILGAMMLLKASEIAVYWFESQVQSKYTVWVQNGVFLIFAAVKVGLILLEAPLTAFVWAMLAEAALVALVLLVVLNLKGTVLTGLGASVERAKTLLKDSWPLILSVIAISVYMKIDQIMLGQMIGNEAVGIYSVAVMFTEVWYFIPMAIGASVFPAIMAAKSQSKIIYHQRMQQLFNYFVLLSIAIALPAALFSSLAIRLLFGVDYSDAGDVLAIYIWASVFVFLGVAGAKWYMAEGLQKTLMLHYLLGTAINVCLNLILIPHFGINGAAIATIACHAFIGLFADLLFEKTRFLFFLKLKAFNPFAALKIKSF